MLTQRTRSKLYIFIYLILGAFGIIMMTQSYQLMIFNWATIIPLLDIPDGLRNLPMVISGGLVVLFSIGNIFQELSSLLVVSTHDDIEALKQSKRVTLSEDKF